MIQREVPGVQSIHKNGQATVVALTGAVDLEHSPAVHRRLTEVAHQQPRRLVIDLAAVTYMDSSGVGTLVEIFRRVQRYGGQFGLAAPTPQVRSLLEITQLARIFPIHPSTDDAVGA